jgi:hypothetical protein
MIKKAGKSAGEENYAMRTAIFNGSSNSLNSASNE